MVQNPFSTFLLFHLEREQLFSSCFFFFFLIPLQVFTVSCLQLLIGLARNVGLIFVSLEIKIFFKCLDTKKPIPWKEEEKKNFHSGKLPKVLFLFLSKFSNS